MFLWKTHIPFSWSRHEATVCAYTTYSLSAGAHDPDIRTGELRHLPISKKLTFSPMPALSLRPLGQPALNPSPAI